jgi:outer membrane protein assembly factor BamD
MDLSRTRIIALVIATCLFTACKTTAPLDAYQGLTDKQIFDRAEINAQKKNPEQAVKDFEALDTLYPFGQYSQEGQMNIIDAYYRSGDNDAAIAAADRYIRLYPRANDLVYAYYMKGIISKGPKESWYERWLQSDPSKREIASQEDALEYFDTLIERFPNTQYAAEAHGHVNEIRNRIAQHELEIAQYYLRRQTYVAAVNRAAELVKNYPRATQQVAPALDVMIQSYRALNQLDMANNAQRVLQNKYPDSKEARKYR